MKKVINSLIAVAALACAPIGIAQAQTAQSLANCMVQNSDANDEQALKNMMIRALQDAPANELQTLTMQVGMSMVTIATTDCGIGMSELDGPVFMGAAEIYGTVMGEKIMAEALAKIG